MAMSDYTEEMLIKAMYNGGSVTAPTAWYVALYNTDPTDDGSGTELTGSGYTTKAFTPATATSETTGWRITNNADITWDTATANWATINYIAIFDGADTSTANLLDYGAITTPRDVLTDGIFKILTGELQVNYN